MQASSSQPSYHVPYHRSATYQQQNNLQVPSSNYYYTENGNKHYVTTPPKNVVTPTIESMTYKNHYYIPSPPRPTQAYVAPEMMTKGQYYHKKPGFAHRFMESTGLSKLGAKLHIYHPSHSSHRFAYETTGPTVSMSNTATDAPRL
ncbi:hypothetical protein HMI54_010987 [Coelomomyces lativittatus]|nr:hypothetical protein HMI56_007442 [Coelomomyces lativittatus]KAJ1516063.1 hypothetical protein HMI54_010987 [Coelomomyces lativittatus]KAJ1516413.1 hypothetical protein HMI55_002324 [Coelomomyces lativittatus]